MSLDDDMTHLRSEFALLSGQVHRLINVVVAVRGELAAQSERVDLVLEKVSALVDAIDALAGERK